MLEENVVTICGLTLRSPPGIAAELPLTKGKPLELPIDSTLLLCVVFMVNLNFSTEFFEKP